MELQECKKSKKTKLTAVWNKIEIITAESEKLKIKNKGFADKFSFFVIMYAQIKAEKNENSITAIIFISFII